MKLEEAKDFCKQWFKDNKVDTPKTSREWSKGRSGITIPPGMTYQTLRRKGISVGDLLELLLPNYVNRVTNKSNDLSFLKSLGLTFIETKGIEEVVFRCNNCGDIRSALKGTLRKWESSNKKFCSVCRKASGKVKDISYYNSILHKSNYSVIDRKDNDLVIKHSKCEKTFTRARGYITSGLEDSGIKCPYCYSGPYFIHNKGKYLSKTEKVLIEYLISIYSGPLEREVPYSTLISTTREYRLDLWIPELNIGMEITSKSNNLPNYTKNLENKLNLAKENNLDVYKVTSKKDIEDIVRPLLKNKEINFKTD